MSDVPLDAYLHGNMLSYQTKGILLLGAPASGKSYLSYELVCHYDCKLIADDLVHVRYHNDRLTGEIANQKFLGKIHLRDVGFYDVDYQLSPFEIHYIYCFSELSNQLKESWLMAHLESRLILKGQYLNTQRLCQKIMQIVQG
ncbi:hypothetical protein [Fangia hongkongensis]|uniref:hypothetical protein n=1 Tax=Fangia hongkongensis TaxID=270495 RepID=UPI000376FA31|nr:hypothetical protein [Fangia hongkongensis]MBK2125170.1 hypothetical protein [Fangia hongkongensis]